MGAESTQDVLRRRWRRLVNISNYLIFHTRPDVQHPYGLNEGHQQLTLSGRLLRSLSVAKAVGGASFELARRVDHGKQSTYVLMIMRKWL